MQHVLERDDLVERALALRAQDRAQQRAQCAQLALVQRAQRHARALARNVVPVEALRRVERKQRAGAVLVVERGHEGLRSRAHRGGLGLGEPRRRPERRASCEEERADQGKWGAVAGLFGRGAGRHASPRRGIAPRPRLRSR